MRLKGNTILVTGGATGIGLALANALHVRGNEVIVCSRNAARLEALRAQQPEIAAYPCDLADDTDQQALVDTLARRHPALNVLINNAGIQHRYAFTDGASHLDRIEEEIGINLLAQLKLTDRLLPRLLDRPNAAIVNVSSALAVVPKQSAPVYCATKAALRSFGHALRYQLEGSPVSVFEIVPSLVETAMTEGRGKGKISPEALAREALRGLAADRHEIRIEKTRLLFALHRLLPSLAARLIRNG